MDEEPKPLDCLKRDRIFTEELGSFKIIHPEPTFGDLSPSAGGGEITSEYKIVYNETRATNRHKNPSGVWRYFALATRDTSTSSNPEDPPDDRILCMLCYYKERVHMYKSKTSSSNLWKHLNRKHGISIPKEKMFTIASVNFGPFDCGGDTEEHSQEANSTDDQLSALDVDDNDGIVVETDEFEEMDKFQEDQITETSMQEAVHSADNIVKYEASSTDPVFKDIGMAIIEEVRKRPILYETQSVKSPSIRATKEIMWAEVCDALGEVIRIERIKKIWKNIRDRYQKIRTAEKEGLDDSLPKYKYYDHLRFLDVPMAIDQTSDTSLDEPPEKKCRTDDFSFLIEQTDAILSTVDEEVDRNEHSYISEEIIHENHCTVSSSDPPITATIYPLEITKKTSEDTSLQQSLFSTSPTNNCDHMDEFDLFGKLIAQKLRSAPRERVNLLEIKIMQTILENS